jgi:ribosomal protein L1
MAPNKAAKKQALREKYRNKIKDIDHFIDILKSDENPCGFVGSVSLIVSLQNRDKKSGTIGCQGMINLPHASGSKKKIMVFLEESKAKKAREMGFFVGDVEKIKANGKFNSDITFTNKSNFKNLRSIVARLGKKRQLPNEKAGTMIAGDADQMLEVAKNYRDGLCVGYKKASNNRLAVKIGNLSLSKEQIKENLKAAISQLESNHSKFIFGKKIISCSMFPVSFEYKG